MDHRGPLFSIIALQTINEKIGLKKGFSDVVLGSGEKCCGSKFSGVFEFNSNDGLVCSNSACRKLFPPTKEKEFQPKNLVVFNQHWNDVNSNSIKKLQLSDYKEKAYLIVKNTTFEFVETIGIVYFIFYYLVYYICIFFFSFL